MSQKSVAEIKAITEVQRAAEAAMKAAIQYIKNDQAPTAEGARSVILKTLKQYGCETPHGVIVAGGAVSAKPHGQGRGKLKHGVPIVIDIYPRSKKTKYFADMTRTVCIGMPYVKLQNMYDAVLGAQEVAFSKIKAGAKGNDIQAAVVNFFHKKGFKNISPRPEGGSGWLAKEGFIHSVGHGVGKNIHEAPRVGHSDDVLEVGDVITVEPGLYYKVIGGVRLEDMVVVTKTGFKNLTKFPKKLVI
jgi:Xaa-Pro aminopeptidase